MTPDTGLILEKPGNATKARTCTEILDEQGYVPPILGGIGQELKMDPKATDLSPVRPNRVQSPELATKSTATR